MRRLWSHSLLVLALLCGQVFLAYHGPSHITGHADLTSQVQLAQDDCQLGGQAHAPALPGGAAVSLQPAGRQFWPLPADTSRSFNRTLKPLARAPPLSA